MQTCQEERPVAAQIFGSKPEEMAHAASLLSEKSVDVIDINMGCPVKKVIKSGSGVALMRDLDRAEHIMDSVVKATHLPVTVKMRSGWDHKNLCAVDLAKSAESAGVSAVIVHPRTKNQMFGGKSDWDVIRHVKESVRIPVIGNGDIRNPEDASSMLKQTGCDGVMIGRAAMGNPWIFYQIRSSLLFGETIPRPNHETICETLLQHFRWVKELSGERKSVFQMRKFAAWYSKGLPGSAEFRARINREVTCDGFCEIVERYFSQLAQSVSAQRALS